MIADIESGKASVIAVREHQWRVEWAKKHIEPLFAAPFPKQEEITPEGWLEIKTPTGYMLIPTDSYENMPKYKKKIIEKYRRISK